MIAGTVRRVSVLLGLYTATVSPEVIEDDATIRTRGRRSRHTNIRDRRPGDTNIWGRRARDTNIWKRRPRDRFTVTQIA
jgi:hypothetical protein